MAFDFTQALDTDVSVAEKHSGLYQAAFKRAIDIAIVSVLAIPAALVVALLAAIIAMDGGAPFYAQYRIGKGGKRFRMWKLRSMVLNADLMLEGYLVKHPEARAEWDKHQKLQHDPRITAIGRLIRKTSLDELPQLWNVLVGEMSLVGPRPMMTDQETLYPGTAYFEMRPGVSGYWQISPRHESSFSERAAFDSQYYRDLSFFTDMLVLFRTASVVLRGTGC